MAKIELSTADPEGHRKWIYPLVSKGSWYRHRRVFAYLLIVWLIAAPWIKIGGKQAIFFDLGHGRIHFLGFSFWTNETMIFLFFILSTLIAILLFTAVLGRVFCGWACPQTVFMEFVFRPIEILIEGMGIKQKLFQQKPVPDRLGSFLLKWGIFAAIAFTLGNTFVAYFFGSHRLIGMILDGPAAHQGPFIGMMASSLFILFQFGWFREQVCLFVCPYGRLQSVLLDKSSLIVAYDKIRGEPRGKLNQTTGDCIDCLQCVKVCPTGIDIRNGLQLECVHCTQCIDACDSIMEKIKKPKGLIRYQTEIEVEGGQKKVLRPRLAIYIVALLTGLGLLSYLTFSRLPFSATLHREAGRDVFSLDAQGLVTTPFRLNLINRTDGPLELRFEAEEPEQLQIELPQGNPVLQAGEKNQSFVILRLPVAAFAQNFGVVNSRFRIVDQDQHEQEFRLKLLGPVK